MCANDGSLLEETMAVWQAGTKKLVIFVRDHKPMDSF